MSLQSQVKAKDKYNGAAFFALSFDFMALFFCQVEFLGCLYSGERNNQALAKNAVKFIRQYLGRVNPRYKEIGGLLYHVYRHGSVHDLRPKTVELENGVILNWEISSGSGYYPSGKHLTGWQSNGTAALQVDEHLLCNDLVAAVDLFYADLCSDQQLREGFEAVVKTLKKPEKLKKKGIYESDFEFIERLPLLPSRGSNEES
jgi:hypothetical protein